MHRGRNVLVFYNRTAGSKGRARKIDRLETALHARAFHTTRIDNLEQFNDVVAQRHESGDLHAAIAAGGDGTAVEVVDRSPSGVRLVTFPLGTENLLSHYLGHPSEPEQTAKLTDDGVPVQLDACRAGKKLFLLMIGVGFDAEVVRGLAETRQGHITRLSYAKPLLSAMRRYSYPEVRVYCSDSPYCSQGACCHEGQEDRSGKLNGATECESIDPILARWVFGINVPNYALGLKFAPDADGTDGLLDLCMFDRGSVLNGFRYLFHLVARWHHRLPDVHFNRCQHVRIEPTTNEPVPYQLDGDPGGFLPVEVTVEPNRLTTIISAERARELRPPSRAS